MTRNGSPMTPSSRCSSVSWTRNRSGVASRRFPAAFRRRNHKFGARSRHRGANRNRVPMTSRCAVFSRFIRVSHRQRSRNRAGVGVRRSRTGIRRESCGFSRKSCHRRANRNRFERKNLSGDSNRSRSGFGPRPVSVTRRNEFRYRRLNFERFIARE